MLGEHSARSHTDGSVHELMTASLKPADVDFSIVMEAVAHAAPESHVPAFAFTNDQLSDGNDVFSTHATLSPRLILAGNERSPGNQSHTHCLHGVISLTRAETMTPACVNIVALNGRPLTGVARPNSHKTKQSTFMEGRVQWTTRSRFEKLTQAPRRGRMLAQARLRTVHCMLLLIAVFALPVTAVFAQQDNTSQGLDEQVQEVKSDVLNIAQELSRLEEKLLYPSGTQVAAFVALSKGDTLDRKSV